MPSATNTLKTTTFSTECDHSDPTVQVSSTANIVPGQFLFANRELMRVERIGITSGINNALFCRRAQGGTSAQRHVAGQIVYIGNGNQFYTYDPKGEPPQAVFVSPHINVLTGDIWVVLGDDGGPQNANRWWSKQSLFENVGPLGVRSSQTGTILPVGKGTVSQTQD